MLWRACLIGLVAIALASMPAWGCSPAGHAFVAAAAVHRLAQSRDPAVVRLAKILHNYRWVVYWGAEGPDVVQNDRGYHASHWFPLYRVNYEHPERFELGVAQPYYNALLRRAYSADYGLTPEDVTRHAIRLVRQPNREWNEVGLAYACGYITHLIADYFCHAPAKVWWDHEPKLPKAVKAICQEDSYGVIQEFYAVMLWERFAKQYGQPENPVADFRSHLAIHHVDNAILPYCALAGSKAYYGDWPAAVLGAVDPSKYDGCAKHMRHRGGKSSGDCVDDESGRVHRMLDHMGMPFDRAIEESNRLTGWQQTYARVITMIDDIWSTAAGQIGLREPGKVNVVLAEEAAKKRAEEPVLPRFSPAKAAQFLDAGARAHEGTCITCHGTLAYLMARPVLASPGKTLAEVRSELEKFNGELEELHLTPGSHPRKIAQTVMTAAALVQCDSATTARLQPVTRQALDRMWQVQQKDGGYNWLKPNLAAPSAVEDHFGVTMAAIAAGLAPDRYVETPAARAGLDKARGYLRSHPPQHMHQRAMLLLADHFVGGLVTEPERRQTVSDLFALQRPDGGWAMGSFGNWKRKDGAAQDVTTSDGYGTGFAVYAVRLGGRVPATDARILRATDWLKTHQRASGGWYTRSPRNSDELSSYVGTVYAILAIDACGQIR